MRVVAKHDIDGAVVEVLREGDGCVSIGLSYLPGETFGRLAWLRSKEARRIGLALLSAADDLEWKD
jgi:hypothetical protein